jgi:hypothetical protein
MQSSVNNIDPVGLKLGMQHAKIMGFCLVFNLFPKYNTKNGFTRKNWNKCIKYGIGKAFVLVQLDFVFAYKCRQY